MISQPAFFVDDPSRYLAPIEKTGSSDLLAKIDQLLAIGFKSGTLRKRRPRRKSRAPWKRVTGRWFPIAWATRPTSRRSSFPLAHSYRRDPPFPTIPTPNFLRETMIQQLAAGSARFDFEVQPRTSPDMSVEDSMTEWKEADAPFFKPATITIPQQLFATPERDQFGENLSFSPWHALPQHRPLGAINRARRVIIKPSPTSATS